MMGLAKFGGMFVRTAICFTEISYGTECAYNMLRKDSFLKEFRLLFLVDISICSVYPCDISDTTSKVAASITRVM